MSFTTSASEGFFGGSKHAPPSSPPPQAPSTPEQPQPRSTRGAAGEGPPGAALLRSTLVPPQEEVPAQEYSEQLELLLVRQRLRAVVDSQRAMAAKLRACQRDNAKLHLELQERCAAYERSLSALEQSHNAVAVAGAEAVAALRSDNQRLAAQVWHLEASVGQLQAEVAIAGASGPTAATPPSEGDDQLIAGLQLEATVLQREVQLGRRARAQAEEARDAVQQQADILRLQVEQMAERLDAEREHNARLDAQLQAHVSG